MAMNVEPVLSQPPKNRPIELVAVVVFVVVNLFAPLVVGEMYPFTISPMFCDQPTQYCTYQLYDEAGSELDLETFGLHLVYDGNPPGLGMGIEAAPQLHPFGVVPEVDEVASHVRKVADELDVRFDSVRVVQTVVCCNGKCPGANVREVVISLSSEGRATE